MFGGLLRAGALPPGAFLALMRGTPMSASLWTRGLVSPHGFGAAATGYSSSLSGTAARQWIRGEEIDPFSREAQRDALLGLALAQVVPAVSRTSHLYWSTRRTPKELIWLKERHWPDFRGTYLHHMRGLRYYPEHAYDPQNLRKFAPPPPRQPGEPRPVSPQHKKWHLEWHRFPDDPLWSRVPSHGPYMPSWPVDFNFHLPSLPGGGKPAKP
jgi:hypothetical protein